MTVAAGHFLEIDWLDYAQGRAEGSLRGELARHLASCGDCRERVSLLETLAEALPDAALMLRRDPDAREAAGELPAEDLDFPLDELQRSAERSAAAVVAQARRDRGEVERARAAVSGLASLSPARAGHVAAANEIARELFRSDEPAARALLSEAFALLDRLDGSDVGAEEARTLLASSRAYVAYRDGEYERALAELDGARPQIARVPFPDREIAYWSYVRACVLASVGRRTDAEEAIREAARIYADYEEWAREARCRVVHAVFVSEGGKPGEAVAIYRGILRSGRLAEDDPLLASLHVNMAYDLVLDGRLSEARVAYARAERQIRRTGQQKDLALRVRIGIADIAFKEGRLQEALALHVELRPELLARHLHWDTVGQELRIAEILIALGRTEEARNVCEALAPLSARVGLAHEVTEALSVLAAREEDLTASRVASMEEYLRRRRRALEGTSAA